MEDATVFASRLSFDWKRTLFSVSATELLNQVKTLPTRERKKFLLAVLTLEEEIPTQRKVKAKRIKWPDVEARARRIIGDRVLPNLVLLEREESAF